MGGRKAGYNQPDSQIAAICDWLSLTVPWDQSDGLSDAVLELACSAGASERIGVTGVYDCGLDGTIKIARRHSVLTAGFSGAALAALREKGVYGDLLLAFAPRPHRVTRLDAAYDVASAAPSILEAIFQRGKFQGIRLGQRPARVSLQGWKIGADGAETGTVYIGSRTSEIRARVYDKRQERLDHKQHDPGPLTRYEISVTGETGVSLKDAGDPTALFWRFAAPALLPYPSGIYVPRWVPGGVGFNLPQCGTPPDPVDRLRRVMEESESLKLVVRLAKACGSYGGAVAVAKFKDLLKVGGVGGSPPTEAVASLSTAGNLSGNVKPTYRQFRREREAAGW